MARKKSRLKRRHDMPFGAECRDDGSVRFRLWAPSARSVDVFVEKTSATLAMHAADDGWFDLITDQAGPADFYWFRIDGEQRVPDPASRFQPQDVHGPSQVIAPGGFEWRDNLWRGRPWEEAIIYELHVGTFTPEGTFASAEERIDYLAELGVTAIELMPLSDFPGRRNWGYDGVFPFAPDSTYGRPEDLKQFIQSAHERGIMVLLDVVYNHFGPEGNYLGRYAPQFFTDRHHTPWGNGLNFDGPQSRTVRDFFIHNALYWLKEYQFDGLRLDAVHAIADDSNPHILTELAEVAHKSILPERYIHLILENERNQSHYLQRQSTGRLKLFTAQWDDDIHHALHVLVTGEHDGYYSDYAECPVEQLGLCLAQGFAFQGEPSAYHRGEARGEPTTGLPPGAFVTFLQNHDQIGNRAFGERIVTLADPRALRAAMAILLLAPSPPLLFMGEEFGAGTPFLYFCDFEKDLAEAVTAGRRNEFSRFPQFNDPARRNRIPDPNSFATFDASRLDWTELQQPEHQQWHSFYRRLLHLRCQHIVPRFVSGAEVKSEYQAPTKRALAVNWTFGDRSCLRLVANLGDSEVTDLKRPEGKVIFASEQINERNPADTTLPPCSVLWTVSP
jgi:malto-oligosyltrehalose trehalohydrolase